MTQYVSKEDKMRYENHRKKKRPEVIIRDLYGPPSSPPIDGKRLNIIRAIANSANEQNMTVEKPKLPAFTTNFVPFLK